MFVFTSLYFDKIDLKFCMDFIIMDKYNLFKLDIVTNY